MSIFRSITFLVLGFIVYKVFVAVKDFEVGLDKRVEKVEALGLGKEDKIGLNFNNIKKEKLFYDVIYNPKETNFLRTGKSLGCKVTNGKMMFIYQAFEAFKIWHKVEPKINEELKRFLDLWKE